MRYPRFTLKMFCNWLLGTLSISVLIGCLFYFMFCPDLKGAIGISTVIPLGTFMFLMIYYEYKHNEYDYWLGRHTFTRKVLTEKVATSTAEIRLNTII